MASFRRVIDTGVSTVGEQVAPQQDVLGGAANMLAQGWAMKKQMDKEQAEKDKKEFISLKTDELLDKAKSFQEQKNWSSTKVNKWLEDQLRKEDPHLQNELMKNVASQRALGGLTLKKTAEDFAIEQDQARIQQGVALLQARGIPVEDITDEAARGIVREQEILQQEIQAQERAKQEAMELAEANSKQALNAIGRYQSKTGVIINSTKASLLASLKGMKEHESALKLVDTYLSNARAVKAQMEASYDQMIGGLSGDDRKEAVEMKKVAMENFNATLDEISEMKDIPLDDMKRIIDIKEKEFILDNEVIIRLGPIRGAMQMMGHDTVDKVREVFDAAMKNGMSSDKKQKLTDALGDEELTHGELMEIMEGEDDVVIGEVALNLHKPYLEAVINGSQSAVGPAKASFFSLMDVVDKDSSQASSILPLALKARPALYESMTEEEKGVFDFTLTDSMRGVVGDPQTGLLADISRHPALKNLEVAGLSKEELFVYQSGKLEVNPAIEEFINQNPSVTVMGPSPSQEQIASKNLSALRRDLDKAAKDINTFISEASTLDSPALKGMTPEQRASYLTSLETGNALSAFSNIPSLDLNPQDVQEAIANGKTVKEIEEENSLAEQRKNLGLATQMMMSVDVNDPQGMMNTAQQLEQEFRGKIPDSQLDMLLTGLTGVANQEVAQQTTDANIQRAEQAETVEGSPKAQEATRSLPQDVVEDTEFLNEVKQTSEDIGVTEEMLLQVMVMEAGPKLDPAQKNLAGGSATGLIQFTKDVAKEMGTSTEELASMTRAEQMKVVNKYLKKRLKGVEKPTLSDLYMAILRPKSVGAPEDSTVYSKGQSFYEANKGLDTNKDGKITKAEATQKVIDNSAMFDLQNLLREASTPEERNQVLIDTGMIEAEE